MAASIPPRGPKQCFPRRLFVNNGHVFAAAFSGTKGNGDGSSAWTSLQWGRGREDETFGGRETTHETSSGAPVSVAPIPFRKPRQYFSQFLVINQCNVFPPPVRGPKLAGASRIGGRRFNAANKAKIKRLTLKQARRICGNPLDGPRGRKRFIWEAAF